MPWTPPTVDTFKIRFPRFVNVDDELVEMLLEEAGNQVGETWVERDRTPAILYLTAHLLVMEGYGVLTPGGNGSSPNTAGQLKRRKVGDVEVEYQNANEALGTGNGGMDRSGYNLTPYGRQFLLIMRRNFPAVAVV